MDHLLQKLQSVQQFAENHKLLRVLKSPLKYLALIPIKYTNKGTSGISRFTKTFWGEKMNILLPSSTDIYLSGGKTHDSEIRLSKFAIKTIKSEDTVFDVGAHFGFFTLLFNKIASQGSVHAFEASNKNYEILFQNCSSKSKIKLNKLAVSDKVGTVEFHEFPSQFSEFNSIHEMQYQNEHWYKNNKPNVINISSISLDEYCAENKTIPNFIKIDVEGAEDKVIDGFSKALALHDLIIVMEYVDASRHNENHKKAVHKLSLLGYKANVINENGNISPINDIDIYLKQENIESDNIVFVKY